MNQKLPIYRQNCLLVPRDGQQVEEMYYSDPDFGSLKQEPRGRGRHPALTARGRAGQAPRDRTQARVRWWLCYCDAGRPCKEPVLLLSRRLVTVAQLEPESESSHLRGPALEAFGEVSASSPADRARHLFTHTVISSNSRRPVRVRKDMKDCGG